jgi:ketosteroid isomerase-like protein
MQFRIAIAIAAAIALTSASRAGEPELQRTVVTFLDSYANGDKAAVLASVAPDIRMYGSDSAEFYSGIDGVSRMFDDDMKLWGGAAKFGTLQDVSTVQEGDLETIFFDVPFSVGLRPPVPVRFSMVWRLKPDGWKLLLSSNVAPTVGQSAADILKNSGH